MHAGDAGLAAARVCQFPSSGFKGICVSDTICAQVCIHEGYGGGQCERLRRRCLCQKKCP
ncbi:hypothetical protein Taro_010021 [Colocasia esculenta]|uniref:Knottins-like domain-containing protein n=1 Tax=Colocasia esculenta TaxID=4460 RepID=A0A843U6J6_COLES|nr:hypothetical protein [Colocasia esculenta]